MRWFIAIGRSRGAIWLVLLLSVGVLGGCAHETAQGKPPKVNADDRLGPMN